MAITVEPWCTDERCTVQAAPVSGSGAIAGVLARAVQQGIDGGHAIPSDIGGCDVIAIGAGRVVLAPVTRGAFSVTPPAGRYIVRFDDCFKCRIDGGGAHDVALTIAADQGAHVQVDCMGYAP